MMPVMRSLPRPGRLRRRTPSPLGSARPSPAVGRQPRATHRPARGLTLAVGSALLVAGVAGCGAGQRAETNLEHSTITPINGGNGAVAIRAAYARQPQSPGGPIAVFAVLANRDTATPDTLQSATSDEGPVVITNTGFGGALSSEISAPVSQVGSQQPVPVTVVVPPRDIVKLEPGGVALVITSPQHDVRQGGQVRVTFTFERGGDVALEVPVINGVPGALPSS